MKKSALLLAALTFFTGGCSTTLVPGLQTYWDSYVKRMCEKDGGVTIYERVTLTPSEYQRLKGIGGMIPVPRRESAPQGYPYVADEKTTYIRQTNPQVFRGETEIVRVSDSKVLSRVVTYVRLGGPEFVPPFSCRDVGIPLDVERQTFEILGSDK